MELAAAKMIGAGIACIALVGAGIVVATGIYTLLRERKLRIEQVREA